MLLPREAIDGLDKRRCAALINSITGFKSANLIATADGNGHSNLAIMSSLLHIGSRPPLLALVFRPDTVERHTLDNIRASGAYTVNHVHSGIVDAAHQTAARYPREVSEFDAVGLSAVWRDDFPAPFVAEAHVHIGMQLVDEQVLKVNGTHLVIGEILSIAVPDEAVLDSGALDPALADTVALTGLDSYYRASPLQRMAYAKPEIPPRRL